LANSGKKPEFLSFEEERLDNAKNVYMFSVFKHTLKTSKGQQILRSHLDSFDARSVYFDLVKAMGTASKGAIQRKKLIKFITSARYGVNVIRCTAEHFIDLYKEKKRLLDELHATFLMGLMMNLGSH
jgi:hypothetical protein